MYSKSRYARQEYVGSYILKLFSKNFVIFQTAIEKFNFCTVQYNAQHLEEYTSNNDTCI